MKPEDTGQILHLVDRICEKVIRRTLPIDEEWRQGGWLVLAWSTKEESYHHLLPFLHRGVGTTLADRAPKYQSYSLEKAQRLHRNPDHQTSWESRDEKLECYGGAIRANNELIVSFSGFSEQWDEAISLFVAIQVGHLDMKQAMRIANKKTRPLLQAIQDTPHLL